MTAGRRRDEQMAIRVSTDLKEKIEEYANQSGLSLSATCAFILSKFFYQMDMQERVLKETVRDMMGEMMMERLKSANGSGGEEFMEKLRAGASEFEEGREFWGKRWSATMEEDEEEE